MTDFPPIACSLATSKSEHRNNTVIREHHICVPDVSDIHFVYNAHFTELLNTNDPPEPTDLHFLNTSLESARSISARLNAGILTIQCALEELENTNTAILTAIAQHRAILSPLRSIPDDILLAIFQWCSSSDTRGVDSLASSRAPWTLSHVSRRWRTLTISSPCLWSGVDITSRDINTFVLNERGRMGFKFKLNLYLRRSAECDLFINIDTHNATFFADFFPLLLSTANRWKSLIFNVYNAASPLRLAEHCFERLTKLNVFFWDDVSVDYRYTWNMPNIRDLSFSGAILETVDLPWERVTNYTCDENGLCHLPQLSALQHLSLAVSNFDVALEMFTSIGVSLPLTLLTLRSISMWQYHSFAGNIEKLSDFLLLPSLTTLTMTMAQQDWKFPRFNGSIHHIQNLSIIFSNPFDNPELALPFAKSALRSFLAKCTSVTALYLKMEVSEEEILYTLADDGALPKLTSLRIAVQSITDCPGSVLDLVELRCQGVNVAPLTELHIVGIKHRVDGETMTDDMLERWRVICGKIKVFAVSENNF